jgi:NAD(P)-dependent dehydrogenase (short-subunit alcohol dehydrogenase family)
MTTHRLIRIDNSFSTYMAYRVAKAAANQVTVTFAREWIQEGRNIVVIAMEPGFVATRLTGWDYVDDMDTCIAGIIEVMEALKQENNERFLKCDGSSICY